MKRPAHGAPAERRFDPFRVLTPEERARHLERYRSWLEARNGDIDLPRRRLSRREAYFRELARHPVAWTGAIDRDGFFQRFLGTGSPPIDARTLWLVAIAKANQGESYGVDLELARFCDAGAADADATDLYLFLEEQYHSRILVEACRTCGLDVVLPPPPWRMRLVIHAIYRLPDRIRWPLILCGEVLGSTVFRLLLDNCALFDEEPEVAARLRSLVSEIWRDEVLHVALLRARLGRAGLAIARRLLPLVVPQLMRDVPQLLELGCDRAELTRRLRGGIALPAALDWVEPARPE